MRNQLSSERDIITYECQARLLNFLAKDVQHHSEGTAAVMDKVLCVLKFFRNVQAAAAKLQERNMPKPPLPAKTRWNTS